MKVEIIKKKGSALPGEILDLEPLDAARLIKAGFAQEAKPEEATETEDEEGTKATKKPKK